MDIIDQQTIDTFPTNKSLWNYIPTIGTIDNLKIILWYWILLSDWKQISQHKFKCVIKGSQLSSNPIGVNTIDIVISSNYDNIILYSWGWRSADTPGTKEYSINAALMNFTSNFVNTNNHKFTGIPGKEQLIIDIIEKRPELICTLITLDCDTIKLINPTKQHLILHEMVWKL